VEKAKDVLKIVVGAGLIVGAVWGITDYALDEWTAELVRALATVMLVLWHRFRPAPGS